MPIFGFLPATDERMRSTIDAIADELTEDGLVLRYRNEEGLNADGLTGEEGTFVICSFWLVSPLAKAGELDRAEARTGRAVEDLRRWSELPADQFAYVFTDHAIEQANARLFRHLDQDRAYHELCWKVATAKVRTQRKHLRIWAQKSDDRRNPAAFWLVSRDEDMVCRIYVDGSHDRAVVIGTVLTEVQAPVGASVRWRESGPQRVRV